MDKNLDNCESGDSIESMLEENSKIVDSVSIGQDELKRISKGKLEDLLLKKSIESANAHKEIGTLINAKFDQLKATHNALFLKIDILEAQMTELSDVMKNNCMGIPSEVLTSLISKEIQTQISYRESQSNVTIGIAQSKSRIRKPEHGPGNTESGSSTSTSLKYKKARTSTLAIRKPGASVHLGGKSKTIPRILGKARIRTRQRQEIGIIRDGNAGEAISTDATADENKYSIKIGPPSTTSGSSGFLSGNIFEIMDPPLLISPIPDKQFLLPVQPAALISLHQPRGKCVIYAPPILKLDVKELGVEEYGIGKLLLYWDSVIEAGKKYAETEYYQLYVCQKSLAQNVEQTKPEWKLMATIQALPLPIACILSQLGDNNRCFFIVRGVDVYNRSGEFSGIFCFENLPKLGSS